MHDPTIRKLKGPVTGYKAFKKSKDGKLYTDGLGNGSTIYWAIGDRKQLSGELRLCVNGFHFFEHECLAIDYLCDGNTICKVIAHGDIVADTFKACTNDIEIVGVVDSDVKRTECRNSGDRNSGDFNSGDFNSGYCNSGDCNSGDHNSGNRNSGDYNSGNRNSGDYNSGDRNSGDCNSGDYNSGDCNSGNRNSGDHNSGDHNSGNRNSGDYNSGNYNSGNYNSGDCNSGDYNSCNGYINFFCTQTRCFLFDIEVSEIPSTLTSLDMTWFTLTSGSTYHDTWSRCPAKILNTLRSIPELQTPEAKATFKHITGIDL
jgi:hypothetical protein